MQQYHVCPLLLFRSQWYLQLTRKIPGSFVQQYSAYTLTPLLEACQGDLLCAKQDREDRARVIGVGKGHVDEFGTRWKSYTGQLHEVVCCALADRPGDREFRELDAIE